jgi:hypothetical protein
LILDSRRVFIGSMNLDPRSVYLNTETGILIDCPELAMDLRASFERLMLPDMSYQVYAGDEPGTVAVVRPAGRGGRSSCSGIPVRDSGVAGKRHSWAR